MCRCALSVLGPDVRVVAGNDVAAAVAHESRRPSSIARAEPAASMTTSTPSPCVRARTSSSRSRRCRGVEVERHVGAHPLARAPDVRRGAPIAKIVDAPPRRASAIALSPTAPVPCTSDAVSGPERGALEDVHRRQQPAAAADVALERNRVGQPGDARRQARDRRTATIRRTDPRSAESVIP